MASRLMRHILPKQRWCIVGLLWICVGWFSAPALAGSGRAGAVSFQSASREVSLTRIVSVLEERMPSRALSEKAKAKLLTMNERQIRIAASLAERIAEEDRTAVAETAFFLLTVLIVLS